MTSNDRAAAIYCRISNDPEGQRLGVDRQEQDCRRLAKRLGVKVVETFTDNDISATSRSHKKRPRYEEMMARAEAGEFSSIIFYSSSRLTRRPADYERLIPLAQKGVAFRSVVSGEFDLTTADGLMMARILSGFDEAEANRISERVKRAAVQRAEQGKWHGGRVPPLGYVTVNGPDGKVASLDIDPIYAPLMQEAAKRVLSGESLYSISADWNHKGLTTREGARWISATIRRSLINPSIIGRRQVDGKLYETGWPEVLDVKTWERVCDLLKDPSRKSLPASGSYAGKYPLGGGIAVCMCGKKLTSQIHRKKVRLMCSTFVTGGCGKVVIAYEPLEQFVLDLVFARLESPEWHAALNRKQSNTNQVEDALRAELRQLKTQRLRVGDAVVIGAYTKSDADQKIREITERQEAIKVELARSTADLVLDGVESANDARKLWADADVQRKRRFISAFITEISIARYPVGWATNLTPRKNESKEDHEARRAAHERAALRERVSISWRV